MIHCTRDSALFVTNLPLILTVHHHYKIRSFFITKLIYQKYHYLPQQYLVRMLLTLGCVHPRIITLVIALYGITNDQFCDL